MSTLFEKKIAHATNKMSIANEVFISKLQDVFSGYSVLFGYHMLAKMTPLIKNATQELSLEKIQFAKTNKVAEGFIGITNIFSQIAIVTYTGLLAGLNIVTIGALSTTGNLASAIFNSIALGSNSLMLMKSTDAYFDKFDKFERKTKSSTESLIFNNTLELRNIHYKIQDKVILENLNMKLEAGKKYAIIGASGSGKSTILNLLAGRIHNFEGDIIIDGKHLNSEENSCLQSITAYTPQSTHLFNDTVINNITLWNNHTIPEAQTSITKLAINTYTSEDYVLQEHGKNLSGGQKQRIAFARALTTMNKIILLDESTANLDKKTALLLENTLLDEPDITLVLVTHHLYDENKQKFDRIFNLDQIV